MHRLPTRVSPSPPRQHPTIRGTAARPFRPRWVDVGQLARQHPRIVVRQIIAEELAAGRVESDGNGRVRILPEAFPPNVLFALENV